MKKKLYLVTLICDGLSSSFACAGETEQEVLKRTNEMYEYDYIEDIEIEEIDKIDGYSIILEKEEE